MKHLLFIVFSASFFTGISQTHKSNDIEVVKQELLISIYSNPDWNKITNHNKSFVSDSKLYYESLNTPKTSTYTYTDKDLIEKALQKYIQENLNTKKEEILDIDLRADSAKAKIEILIPEKKIRFIDLFLLKKIGDDWKIISKTATQTLVKHTN